VKVPWKKLIGKALRWLGREIREEIVSEVKKAASKSAKGTKRP
jgi:hypothetical protein